MNALVWIGSILLDAGRVEEALAHFELAARRNPTLADAFVGVALVMVQRRQFADAEGALRRAESIDPRIPASGRRGRVSKQHDRPVAHDDDGRPGMAGSFRSPGGARLLTLARRGAIVQLGLLIAACRSPAAPPAPAPAPATAAGPGWFEEVAKASGISWTHKSGHETRYLLPEIMGGGAALFDMDGDGDLDLYLVQSGSVLKTAAKDPSNRLYRNRGDGAFEDVTAGSGTDVAGYGMGVAAGDFDNDGDIDLFVTNTGPNILLRNEGEGHFTDVTATAGVAGRGWSTSAAFFDADGDGDLDLFALRYINWSVGGELSASA